MREGNLELITSPVRHITGQVSLLTLTGSTAFTDDKLLSITLERVGEEGKFFGFGITHKANVKIEDRARECQVQAKCFGYIYFNNSVVAPRMITTEVHRDENTNALSITLYDRLYDASNHTVSELNLSAPYTIGEFADACAKFLGNRGANFSELPEFALEFPEGANFEGTETLRDALNDVAEATQTVYYINVSDFLTFKRLDKDGAPVLTIDKEQYITLDTKTNRRLTAIVSATELGDNLEANTGLSGSTQYVRDNAFWDLREDRAELVQSAMNAMANMTINQFSCSWRGNYLLEPGDKIGLITKDNEEVHSFLINDTISFDGSFAEETKWEYADEDAEHTNSVSLGEVIKQTYAKVDKANKEITLVANEANEKISQLQIDTSEIVASVTSTENVLNEMTEELDRVSNQASLALDSGEVQVLIQQELANGVGKVATSTGFVFDDTGLTISKSESDITTTVTEDGMNIHKGNKEVLTASNEGVKAIDLHATTYLIIGKYSRFEDYGSQKRTACYWIGG